MNDNTPRESPEHVRLSSAAAMTLGLKGGRFHRHAKLHCLNILLTYDDGCLGKCAYCGLSGARRTPEAERSFIRVDWPTHSMDEVLARMKPAPGALARPTESPAPNCAGPTEIERVCISMVTRRRAVDDVKTVSRRIREVTDVPISFLVAPTLVPDEEYAAFKEAGAGWIGIAVDAATPELFERHRGAGVSGPHRWDRYWESVRAALDVFGEGRVGLHLVVGLGETEREMIEVIQRARDLGAPTHLFSVFPEDGSALADGAQPSAGHYRRVQLARFLIDEGFGCAREMSFDEAGRVTGFGVDDAALDEVIASGLPFRTSGCPGRTVGDVCGRSIEVAACNRPYANCRPGDAIRNFPFQPDEDDVALVRRQLEA